MTNAHVQAAAEGLPNDTRRRFLQMLPAAAVATALPAPREAEAAMSPLDAAHYHAAELAKAMGQIKPDRVYRFKIDEEHGFAFIVGDRKEDIERAARPIYDGPNFYEVELSNGKRPILWLERIEYRFTPGHYYVAESRWKGRLEGKPRRLREKQFAFVRKVENFAGRA